MLTIKIVQVPGAVQEVVLENGATVSDALSAANITVGSNECVKVNNEDVAQSTLLENGDRIVVAKGAKGN